MHEHWTGGSGEGLRTLLFSNGLVIADDDDDGCLQSA